MNMSLLDENDYFNRLEVLRLAASRKLEPTKRVEMGQFLTPAPVARLMASMFACRSQSIAILDAGAGVGSLFAALTLELCRRVVRPTHIHVVAYELDPMLLSYLNETVAICEEACRRVGIHFTADIRSTDFVCEVAEALGSGLFARRLVDINAAILNPPYRKIRSGSATRNYLRQLGIETSNMYSGFLSAAVKLLAPDGELVAITPRSFCNGSYFRAFRGMFLREMALRRMHVFDTRDDAFKEDSVLQETVILRAVKGGARSGTVTVSSSAQIEDEMHLSRDLAYSEVLHPDDPEQFIRVVPDGFSQQILSRMSRFSSTLASLGLTVSTGRVVDFRAKEHLRSEVVPDSVPLIYPANMENGYVVWPKHIRKPQALAVNPETQPQLVPSENYVLVKRFTSKEQPRRVVACVLEGQALPGDGIAIENHINYYHKDGRGLDITLAKGLSGYLNSTLVDEYFRQFNGNTQVNATDLRSLKYPTVAELLRLGQKISDSYPPQHTIDSILEEEFFHMIDPSQGDPISAKKRIEEALEILRALGFPKRQINERSALTLLALLDLSPERQWSEAANPLRGITPMMEFMDQQYGKRYAPNTRETVRRQTVHQFREAGLIVANPDNAGRPTNSGLNVYQIEESALGLLRTYGTNDWEQNLSAYLATVETLKDKYAQLRHMARIPILLDGRALYLSPGGQNVLIKQIIEEFAPRFTPGGNVIYIGDTGEKMAFNAEALRVLGVSIEEHDKMPDVIIHYVEKNWLVLIEAVTSHGPIDPKRKAELFQRFGSSSAGLVLVTAFLNRRTMNEYLSELSWETDVWVADSPDHLIHFDGEQFLGPYGNQGR